MRPEPATTTGSPTLTVPTTTVPEKPRKAASGRLTHCTGKRNGAVSPRPLTSTVSRWASSDGPSYQGVRLLERATVVAVARRDRHRQQRAQAQGRGERLEGALDLPEAALGEIDQVHLVDRQHDIADAEQRDDRGMATGLLDQPVAGIDQQDGEIGVRRAGRHVARELLVARRVGDDEGAPRAGEEAVGDVDGDALLALGLQPVEQQREVDSSPAVPKRREFSRSAASWSSSRPAESAIRRPIRVDLPSSTEPQARKRSALLCCRLHRIQQSSVSEVALALLALHRIVARAHRPAGRCARRLARPRNSSITACDVLGIRFDRAGQRPAAERPEAHAAGLDLLVGVQVQALVVDRDPGIAARAAPGRSAAKYSGTIEMDSAWM